MARETFIAYKYSEAAQLRDKIIEKLGAAASYYQGETAESPDLTDASVEKIKEHLKNMIFGTSVTIVVISPEMKNSKWIDWEIEYSLKEITRNETTSRCNGIVGVIMKVNGSYDWLVERRINVDGCTTRFINNSMLYDIIKHNRFNSNQDERFSCRVCKSFHPLNGSYISLIDEDTFLKDPNYYIENAYEKSKTINNYILSKTR